MTSGCSSPATSTSSTPRWRVATVDLLERLGMQGALPRGADLLRPAHGQCRLRRTRRHRSPSGFSRLFEHFDYVVCPSGSCVVDGSEPLPATCSADRPVRGGRGSGPTSCASSSRRAAGEPSPGGFPHRVGLHQSCHGLRELRLGSGSERVVPRSTRSRSLCSSLEGIELVGSARPDECCGFGGMFAVAEEAVSCVMGQDRIADHERGRGRSDHRQRHVLPDAPGRAHPPGEAAAARACTSPRSWPEPTA